MDAYDDANAESDLGVFSKQFGLPACTSSNGCFRKVYSNGKKPVANANWAVEIALDVEWAHAIAPKATILLVETPSNSLTDLIGGVTAAVRDGASAVSMSWTVNEFVQRDELGQEFRFERRDISGSFGRCRDRRGLSGRVAGCDRSRRNIAVFERQRKLPERNSMERQRRRVERV